ncbi:hypothetical protein OPV22_016815 [Ensete ventricosum]|uniref:Protein kinase domain-containing protein n=1 Tax=Ensete ventricosum TaxID=4639 RepID=A0AAV8PEM5_ENSVE|nr:hypothetical protein OPV22_016815 [Ensete ventricosum]
MLMTCLSFLFKRRNTSRQQAITNFGDISGMESMIIYSYKDLSSATENFSPGNKIGEGGFGSVYKGKLKDGRVGAIKVLSSKSKQGVREFLNEIKVVSSIAHENLVRLYGCCVEGDHRILVYKYLENNSLAHTLLGGGHSNTQFSWETRSKICLLPSNTTHVSTRVAGTIGYLAPEYAIHGQLTRRADTYSFGVLLLEIVSGRCNTNTRLPYEDQFLLERAWALYERGEVLSIVDTSLGDDFDAEEACKFIKIALLCTQDAPKLRPSMPAVVRMLRGESNVSMEITKPGLITDLMDLKVRRQRDAGEPDASPVVFTTLHGSPSSSSGNATPNMSSSSTAAELA